MNGQQIVGAALLIIVLGCGCASALSCYKCNSKDSPATCTATWFVSIGTTVETDCTCCRKTVTKDETTRECSTVACIPIPDTNYVCSTDKCNEASMASQGVIAVVLGAAAIAMIYQQL